MSVARRMYNIKFVNAHQAKTTYNFKSRPTEEKLLKTNPAICNKLPYVCQLHGRCTVLNLSFSLS